MAPALNLPAPKNEVEKQDAIAGPSSSSSKNKAARVDDVDEESEESKSDRFRTGGLIYPPPELRSIVDKTAQYVARNGIEFESKIRGDNAGSNRLAFLNDEDPYHAYYQAKLEAFKSGTGPLANFFQAANDAGTDMAIDQSTERIIPAEERPEEPEPFKFSADMPNITALDLDIVKLTALFVAKRGRAFASTLQKREGRSYQFEFLRPSHSLFGFFNRLVEQYQMVMEPSAEMNKKIRIGAFGKENPIEGEMPVLGMGRGGARPHILEEIRKRAEWEKWEKTRRRVAEDEEEKERAAFNEIDWHDFVVAGTVEITEADEQIDLPPPMSLREVKTMSIAQKRMAAMIMEGEAADEQEEESDMVKQEQTSGFAENTQKGVEQSTTSIPLSGPMKIRKDYQPKTLAERKAAAAAASGGKSQMTTCPVCGERVPIDGMDEHVRFELLDPRFREQRRELESKRAQHNALYEGADPSQSLRQFAGNRTDIFGGEMEEEAHKRREQEEARKRKERESIVWDGHAASRLDTRAEFNRPDALQSEMQQIQKRFKTDQPKNYLGPQMHDQQPAQFASPVHMQDTATIQQQPSTVPLVSSAAPMGQNGYPQGHYSQGNPSERQIINSPSYPNYTAAYDQRSPYTLEKRTDGGLYPEAQWLQYHPNPIDIVIQLPKAESISSACDGSRITFRSLSMQTTIGSIRDKLQSETLDGKIGASRLKLRVEGKKPTTLRQTLAYWNMKDQDELMLNVG